MFIFCVFQIFKAMNVQMFKYDTFRRHAQNLLEPAINHKWKKDQQTLFQILKQESSIAVGGDMRADSPGEESILNDLLYFLALCLVIGDNIKV